VTETYLPGITRIRRVDAVNSQLVRDILQVLDKLRVWAMVVGHVERRQHKKA